MLLIQLITHLTEGKKWKGNALRALVVHCSIKHTAAHGLQIKCYNLGVMSLVNYLSVAAIVIVIAHPWKLEFLQLALRVSCPIHQCQLRVNHYLFHQTIKASFTFSAEVWGCCSSSPFFLGVMGIVYALCSSVRTLLLQSESVSGVNCCY